MATFDDRERAFEKKYAQDEEMAFRAVARRNKLVGLWAAGLLGKSGEAADAYAMEVVRADFAEPGDGDVIRKLVDDLGDKSNQAEIEVKMAELLATAKGQLVSDTP